MQKSVRILIIVLLSLLAAAAVVFFTPKTFGKHADLSKVDHINVSTGAPALALPLTTRKRFPISLRISAATP